MKPILPARVDQDLIDRLKEFAKKDNRSLSNYVETILNRHVKNKSANRFVVTRIQIVNGSSDNILNMSTQGCDEDEFEEQRNIFESLLKRDYKLYIHRENEK